MKILVDAMGGDNAPLCVLQGASQAAAEFGDGMTLTLLGEEKAIRDCAAENKIDLASFEIINCTENIDMHDDPVKAVRHKKDSSLVKGLTMLKNGEGDAFVSAGSTGALHVGTSLIVRTVKGVKRPALATPMPGAKQNFLLLDCGANVECRPEMLNAFGTMGSVYAEKVMGRTAPKVALVNNGAEDTKGTPTYREAHQLLKANPCIHFAGNIEPRYIMDGEVDVVVCDGFVGNVVLKLTEGVAKTLLGMLKKIFLQNLITKLSYLGIKGGLGELKRMMDSEEVGGAAGRGQAGHQGSWFQPRQGHQERHPPGQALCSQRPVRHDGEGAGRGGRAEGRKSRRLKVKLPCRGRACPARSIKMITPSWDSKARLRAGHARPLRPYKSRKGDNYGSQAGRIAGSPALYIQKSCAAAHCIDPHQLCQ